MRQILPAATLVTLPYDAFAGGLVTQAYSASEKRMAFHDVKA